MVREFSVDNWAFNGNFYAAFSFLSSSELKHLASSFIFGHLCEHGQCFGIIFVTSSSSVSLKYLVLSEKSGGLQRMFFSKISTNNYKKVALKLLFNALFPLF